MIRIITDSVSDIPVELCEELNIKVMPLVVHIGEQYYKDGIDLTPEDFFQLMAENENLPTTSQVSPGEFLKAFDELTSSGDTVIAILMSSALSGTYNSALTAKEMLKNRDIEVIDSKGVTLGYGLLVIEAARMAKEGHPKEDIVKRIQYMIGKMEYKFIVDTLDNLYKGGRLSAVGAIVGKILNIKPILKMEEGKLILEDKVRGRRRAIKWVIDWIQNNDIDIRNQTIGINHSNDEEYALELIGEIEEHFAPKEIILSQTGCVVGTHAGPGAVAIYFLDERHSDK
ncbi:DegV family protein [Geosporobacter ferrireducens]|uniref:Fatty acid-binding protein DegV n=1 Tax=Geosporobacter ferrireducens TaxID=1424294 RepID=A0A1D8GNB1_9FIRM|nr:DegV family protein [Geosporobacter ferrireducens]AOT72408.1 hypothetical protein Gferi_24360 [Geosporobacter ferrireducens]